MSFQKLTPLSKTALLYNQTGSIFVTKNNADVTGHIGGFEGVHTQEYLEILAGNECIPSSIWSGSSNVVSVTSNGTFWLVYVNEATSVQVGNIVRIRGTSNHNGDFVIDAVSGDKKSVKILNTNNYTNESGLTAIMEGITMFTSANNTTGTMYYPEIAYFTGFKNYSINSLGAIIELEMSAQSIVGDDYATGGLYGPGGGGSSFANYIFIFHGDEVFGKFNRIAIYKTAGVALGRLRIMKGPSLN